MADCAGVDKAVADAKANISSVTDELMQIVLCGRHYGPAIAKLLHNVLQEVYGARAMHTTGRGQVEIAYIDNHHKPASIIFSHDSYDLEVLLDDGTLFRGKCADIVDFLKENVPV
jgi:hypothetical protein